MLAEEKNVVKSVVQDLISSQDDQILAVILIGSANSTEYISNFSDIDLVVILRTINSNVIRGLESAAEKSRSKYDCEIDVKLYTINEFNAGKKGLGSFDLFNKWGLMAIKEGLQNILYQKSSEISFDYQVRKKMNGSDSLDRAQYYMTKLRKVFSARGNYLLRGKLKKGLNQKERVKIARSSIKNVLTFCLAYRGTMVFRLDDIIAESRESFELSDEILDLLTLRDDPPAYDSSRLENAYNQIESLYSSFLDSCVNQ